MTKFNNINTTCTRYSASFVSFSILLGTLALPLFTPLSAQAKDSSVAQDLRDELGTDAEINELLAERNYDKNIISSNYTIKANLALLSNSIGDFGSMDEASIGYIANYTNTLGLSTDSTSGAELISMLAKSDKKTIESLNDAMASLTVSDGKYIKSANSVGNNLTVLDTNLKNTNTKIDDSVKAITEATTVSDGKYIKSANSVGDNLTILDTNLKNTDAKIDDSVKAINGTIEEKTSAITTFLGTATDGNYIKSGSSFANNLATLDTAIGAPIKSQGSYIYSGNSINENLMALDTGINNVNNSIDTKINTAKNEIDTSITSQINDIKQQISDGNITVGGLGDIKDNITNVETQITENTSNIAQNTQNITQNTNDIANLNTKTDNIQNDLNDVTNRVGTLEEKVDKLDNISADVSGLKDTVEEQGQLISQNTADIELNAENIAANAADITSNKEAIAANAADITSNKEAIADLDTRVTTNEQHITEIQDQLQGGIDGVATSVGDLNDLNLDSKNLTGGTEDAPETITDALNNIDSTLGTIHGLKDKLQAENIDAGTNLAQGTTVEQHLTALDAAIGNRGSLNGKYVSDTDVSSNLQSLNNGLEELGTGLSNTNWKLNKLSSEMKGGFASIAAMTALVPNSRTCGDTQLSFGTGNYDGHQGFAFGAFHYLNNNTLLNVGYSYGGNNSSIIKGGVTFSW